VVWGSSLHCVEGLFDHIGLTMEGVVDVVYYDGDVVSSCEGVLFECPDSPKEIKISDKMSLLWGKQLQISLEVEEAYLRFFTVNMYMWVMVVLSMIVWSLKTTMMWEKVFFFYLFRV